MTLRTLFCVLSDRTMLAPEAIFNVPVVLLEDIIHLLLDAMLKVDSVAALTAPVYNALPRVSVAFLSR